VVLRAFRDWAEQEAQHCPSLQRVGVYGSDGRGDAGVGSDLDLVLIDAAAKGTQSARYRTWPFERLPLSCDALVLTPDEWRELMQNGNSDPVRQTMVRALQSDARWICER
jgi:hypothetical protein